MCSILLAGNYVNNSNDSSNSNNTNNSNNSSSHKFSCHSSGSCPAEACDYAEAEPDPAGLGYSICRNSADA